MVAVLIWYERIQKKVFCLNLMVCESSRLFQYFVTNFRRKFVYKQIFSLTQFKWTFYVFS